MRLKIVKFQGKQHELIYLLDNKKVDLETAKEKGALK